MIKRWLPLILGVIFGAISIIIGQVPTGFAVWSGLRVLGNNVGYLLVALLLAFINSEKWGKGFFAATAAIVVANVVYYVGIFAIYTTRAGVYYSFEWADFLFWTIIGVICGALAATAVRLFVHSAFMVLKYGAFFVSYLGMLWVIYFAHGVRFINVFFRGTMDGVRFYESFAGGVFELVFAFVIVSVLFGVGFLNCRKRYSSTN